VRIVAAATTLLALTAAACTSTKPKAAPVSASPAPGAASGPTLPAPNAPYDPNSDPIVETVHRVQPSVVNVTTRTVSQDVLFGGGAAGTAVGTGFVIRSDGIVVTNFHVIEGALSIKVTLPPPGGRTFQAHWIGGDSDHDLAVLKLDGARNLTTVPLGDSDLLKLGERVVALGYALALPGGPTVTSGIISALERTVQASDPNAPEGTRTYQDVLQTDAAINPGNSGGPLVDLSGNVVGINTAGANTAENVGFSIAIDAAKAIIDAAIAHPAAPTAYLGVSTETVGSGVALQLGLPVDHGVLVVQTAPGGPADNAGLEVGDVIVGFDGRPVNTQDDLGSLIRAHRPGDRVSVKVVHGDGSNSTVTVTLVARPVPVASPSPSP